MARRKQQNKDALLARPVSFRLTEKEHRRLESIRRKSDCHSIGEVIRRTLAGKPVRVFTRDTTRDALIEELAGIRHELRLIGVNINQVTRHFNGSNHPGQRLALAGNILEQYRQVGAKVSLLLSLISQLAKKW